MMNNSAWPPEIIAKLGDAAFRVVSLVKRAKTQREVDAIVAAYNLTKEELLVVYTKMDQAATQHDDNTGHTKAGKQRFYAAAWKVGAKYTQIASVSDVSRQTVQSAVTRLLGLKPDRLVVSPVTIEQVESMYNNWANQPNRSIGVMADDFLHIIATWDE